MEAEHHSCRRSFSLLEAWIVFTYEKIRFLDDTLFLSLWPILFSANPKHCSPYYTFAGKEMKVSYLQGIRETYLGQKQKGSSRWQGSHNLHFRYTKLHYWRSTGTRRA